MCLFRENAFEEVSLKRNTVVNGLTNRLLIDYVQHLAH